MTEQIIDTVTPEVSPELLALRETLDGIFAPVATALSAHGARLEAASAHFGENAAERMQYRETFHQKENAKP